MNDMKSTVPLLYETSHSSGNGLPSCGESIRLLNSPVQYYNEILNGIRNSKIDIILCALYFGTEEQERVIIDEVESALIREKRLLVKIVFDHSRTLRKNECSLLLFQNALSRFQDRVELCLYKMPVLNQSYWWVPSPLKETLGVYHCKFCVFDNVAFVSGANLSKSYFTNRQDRYLSLSGETFSNFFKEFFRVVRNASHVLGGDGDLLPPNDTSTSTSILKQQLMLLGTSPSITCSDMIHELGAIEDDTYLYPIFQHFSIGVQSEMDRILDVLSQNIWKEIVLSSPYCSYTPNLASALRKASENGTDISIITCSRDAHGFAGAKGLAGVIPELHDISLFQLMKSLEDLSNVQTFVYHRPDWSFHAKGIWCFPRNRGLPVLSYIGSSNGGERSWYRDFELGFLLSTKNVRMKSQLWTELRQIQNHCRLIKNGDEIVKNISMLRL